MLYINILLNMYFFFKYTKHVLNEKYKRKEKQQEENLNSDYQNINRKLIGNFDIVDVILIVFQYK